MENKKRVEFNKRFAKEDIKRCEKMKDFIEVTTADGTRYIVNTRQIQLVYSEGGTTYITIANIAAEYSTMTDKYFNTPFELAIQETYEQVKAMLISD